MKRLLRMFMIGAGFCIILTPLGMLFLGWMTILGAGQGEYFEILQTDRPHSYDLLTFGPWQPGSGLCQTDDFRQFPDGTKIVQHRIGSATDPITRFTYYEAKYQLPDGTIRITYADGPVPLISIRDDTMIASFLLCPFTGAALLVTAAWLKKVQDLKHLPSNTTPDVA